MPPGRGLAAGTVAAGGIFVWSALFNKSVTSTIQALVVGEKPQAGPPQSSGFQPGSGGFTTGGGHPLPPSAPQAQVIKSILSGLGAPATSANMTGMTAWQAREAPWNASPPDGAEYTHNPWNTTLTAGSVGIVPGTPGVRIYPDWQTGINATVQTLQGYPGIVAALKSGNGICGGGLASEFSTWSDGGYSSVC